MALYMYVKTVQAGHLFLWNSWLFEIWYYYIITVCITVCVASPYSTNQPANRQHLNSVVLWCW